ncbi:hypothetical protein [Bacillus thuringiensis]|uniref:hypothetical protein n=1 Tax=Bacillus thuringiensis TaxID=1428 RepID=UPI000CF995D1|nr:hypothetical protein [Bacillus thuringiensis]PQQ45497.1 hypothetical protein C6A34_19405 [Bacillus thuringiensis]
MKEIYTFEHYRDKIIRKFETVMKTKNSEDFHVYIADFLDFLCEDSTLLFNLTQLINKTTHLESELKQFNNDINQVFNWYVVELWKIIKEKGLKATLDRLNPEGDIIPLVIRLGGDPYITSPEVLYQRSLQMDKFIRTQKIENELNQNVLTHNPLKIELKGRVILHNQLLDKELKVPITNEIDTIWHVVKNDIDTLHFFSKQIAIQNKLNVRNDILEILAHTKYHFPFFKNLKRFYELNPIVECYRQETRNEIVLDLIDKTNWDFKLEKIVNTLINNLDRNWNLDIIIKNYCTKIEQFGVSKLIKIINEESSSKTEKILQLDLAEHLFDKGLKPIIEKTFYKDRMDIITTENEDQVIEVKLFKGLNSLEDVFQGFAQTFKYMVQHQKYAGYYVIYQLSTDYKLITEGRYQIGNRSIYVYVIDISSLTGRTDRREAVYLTHDEINNYFDNKNNPIKKNWSQVLLSDLILVEGIGGKLSYNIYKVRKNVNRKGLLKLSGIGFRKREAIDNKFDF